MFDLSKVCDQQVCVLSIKETNLSLFLFAFASVLAEEPELLLAIRTTLGFGLAPTPFTHAQ